MIKVELSADNIYWLKQILLDKATDLSNDIDAGNYDLDANALYKTKYIIGTCKKILEQIEEATLISGSKL